MQLTETHSKASLVGLSTLLDRLADNAEVQRARRRAEHMARQWQRRTDRTLAANRTAKETERTMTSDELAAQIDAAHDEWAAAGEPEYEEGVA